MRSLILIVLVALFTAAFVVPGCTPTVTYPVAAPITISGPVSCVGADGLNHCGPNAKSAHVRVKLGRFGASAGGTRASTIPPSWTVPAWFYDPLSSLSCASDNNNCTQNTCGAAGSFAGPCVSYAEIQDRWGTTSPVFQQNTSMTLMSSAASSDPVYVYPKETGPIGFVFQCTLPAPTWTASLGTVIPKSRSGNQLLEAPITPTGGAVTTLQLVVNSNHPSRAWTATNPSSNNWTFLQPVTGCTPPTCSPSEVDSWTTGDSVTGYVPLNVYIVDFLPSGASRLVYPNWISGCAVQSVGGTAGTFFSANQNVIVTDSLVYPMVFGNLQGVAGGPEGPRFSNSFVSSFRGSGLNFFGGGWGNLMTGLFTWSAGVSVDGDTYAGTTTLFYPPYVYIGTMYILGEVASYGVYISMPPSGQLYGPGYFQTQAGSFLSYGSGDAGGSFPLAGGLYLNGLQTACNTAGTSGVQSIYCGKSLTPALLDTSIDGGGFGGHAFQVGGGQISTTGQ